MPAKQPYTQTFYTRDHLTHHYIRLAIIESPGLANILLQPLRQLYPDNLYAIHGAGPKKLTAEFPGYAKLTKVRP